MTRFQYNILFAVMVGGAIVLMFAKKLGIDIDPAALTGYGAISTYVLTQRGSWTKNGDDKKDKKDDE